MKQIVEARKLLNTAPGADLATLKNVYRGLMKEFHPDRFAHSEEERVSAEEKSKAFIAAYHLLVSVAPETQAAGRAEYNQTLSTQPVVDFHFEKGTLRIDFANGSRYEYFSVPKAVYEKLVYAPSPPRFIRRHIAGQFTYRKLSDAMMEGSPA